MLLNSETISHYCDIGKKMAADVDPWKSKYLAIKQLCEEQQMVNEQLANRIKDFSKVLARMEMDKKILLKKYKRHGGSANLLPSTDMPLQTASSLGAVGDSVHGRERPLHKVKAPTATKPRASAVRKSQKLADQASSSKGDKKERDPALPKKPSNPFFWFCQEHRAAVQEQCARESSAGHHELTKALARMWNDTSEEDKKKYRDLYESDKLRYDKEMGEYVSKHGHAAVTKLMGNKGKRGAGSRS